MKVITAPFIRGQQSHMGQYRFWVHLRLRQSNLNLQSQRKKTMNYGISSILLSSSPNLRIVKNSLQVTTTCLMHTARLQKCFPVTKYKIPFTIQWVNWSTCLKTANQIRILRRSSASVDRLRPEKFPVGRIGNRITRFRPSIVHIHLKF